MNTMVTVHGLKKANHLNGKNGKIIGNFENGRYPVEVDGSPYRIKEENLTRINQVTFCFFYIFGIESRQIGIPGPHSTVLFSIQGMFKVYTHKIAPLS